MSQRKSYNIMPFPAGAPDIGQRKHQEALIQGAFQEDAPMFFISGNIRTTITGLNEDGPEVTSLPAEEQNKKRLEIRKFIAKCENELAGNYLVSPDDVEDKTEFYKKVNTFKSIQTVVKEGDRIAGTIWDTLTIKLDNAGIALMDDNLTDRLKAYVASAGGYGLVAKSISEAKREGRYMFYFDSIEESAADRISAAKIRNKAAAKLETLYDNNTNKLFYITKLISKNPLQYMVGKNGTPNTVLYEVCDNFINGTGKVGNKYEACQQFIKLVDEKLDDLRIKCYLQDGMLLGKIQVNSEGNYIFVPTGTALGKSKEAVLASLAVGISEPVYEALSNACETHWKNE
jgi:hypothetical protein